APAAKQERDVTIGKVPWIPISVTSRQRGDPHFSRSNESAAVTNGTSFRHIAHESNSRFPCHRRFEKFLKFRQRRNPVKHDAGAHHIKERIIKRECAGALQDVRFEIARNCSTKLLNDFAESLKLVAGVRGVLIGNWQMGRDAMDLDVWEPRN